MNSRPLKGRVRAAALEASVFSFNCMMVLDESAKARPVALEAENFFGRRQRGLRLDPSYRLGAQVLETVDASHARPDGVARPEVIHLAVGRPANASRKDQVGFLERMVVRIDFGAGQILDQKQRLMNRSEGTVHEHFNSYAGGGIEALHLGRSAGARQLGFVEMPKQK